MNTCNALDEAITQLSAMAKRYEGKGRQYVSKSEADRIVEEIHAIVERLKALRAKRFAENLN